jgi:PAS domain S-box-containing protein
LRYRKDQRTALREDSGVKTIALAESPAFQHPAQLVYPRLRDCRLSCWLVEVAKDWIWELDASGRYTYSGPEVKQLLGYQPEEVIGKSFFDLMPDYEAVRIRTEFETCSKPGLSPRQLETLKVAKDGQVVRLESVVIPLVGTGGELEGYGGLDRGLAQQKNTSEAMALLESDVAHDLNNLFAVILGETELLQDTADEQQLRGILAIQEAARKASFLNGELRTFRRMQALSPQPLDLGVIIANSASLMQRLLSKSISLKIEIGQFFKPVRTHPSRIQQVLMALAMNGRRIMTGGGSIRIKISTRRFAESDPLRPAEVVPGNYILLETTATSGTKQDDAHSLQPLSSFDRSMNGTVQQFGGYVCGSGSMNGGRILTILLPIFPSTGPREETGSTLNAEHKANSDRWTDLPVASKCFEDKETRYFLSGDTAMTIVATMRTKGSEPKTHVVPKPKEEQTNTNMEAEIRTRAYQIYEQRGRADGHDSGDWLQAESEIIQRRKAA